MTDVDTLKAKIHHWYRKGEVSEVAAIDLLGEQELRTAEENTRGADRLLSGDTTRFIDDE